MPKQPKIHICKGDACTKAGTQDSVHKWILEYFTDDEISECSCLGLCHDNFAILYKGKAYSVFTKKTLKSVLKASSTS